MGFIGYVAVLDTDNQSYHAGDTGTNIRVSNEPKLDEKTNSQGPCRKDS